MRRSTSLFSAALLGVAVVSIGGHASAEPQQVIVHNSDTEDVIVTITDLNTPHGLIIANQQGVDAGADLPLKATLDSHGAYRLHWKAQDQSLTRSEEGDCLETPVFNCPVSVFLAP